MTLQLLSMRSRSYPWPLSPSLETDATCERRHLPSQQVLHRVNSQDSPVLQSVETMRAVCAGPLSRQPATPSPPASPWSRVPRKRAIEERPGRQPQHFLHSHPTQTNVKWCFGLHVVIIVCFMLASSRSGKVLVEPCCLSGHVSPSLSKLGLILASPPPPDLHVR